LHYIKQTSCHPLIRLTQGIHTQRVLNLSNHLKNWQRPLQLALLTALGFSLAGCVLTVVPGGPGGTTTTISNLSFSSDRTDNQGKSYVCDNATTGLTYTFRYSGQLDYWNSVLVGQKTGQQAGNVKLSLSSPGVNGSGDFVSVTYNVPPRTAPLSDPAVTPQSIIVSPAVIGSTDLVITFYDNFGNSGTVKLNQGIPVVSNC
jgi:hypothetical protein